MMTIDEIIKYIMDCNNVNKLTFDIIDKNGNKVKYNTENYIKYMYKLLDDKRDSVSDFIKTQVRDNNKEFIWSLEKSLEELDNYLNKYLDFDNYDNSNDTTKRMLVETIKLYSSLTVVFNSIIPVVHLDSVQ